MAKTTDDRQEAPKAKAKSATAKTKTSARRKLKSKTTESGSDEIGPLVQDRSAATWSRASARVILCRAKHGYMQLILTHNGASPAVSTGDLVKVRPGFARNCLVPSRPGNVMRPKTI